MSKFYAVKAGKIPGIYTSWEECEKNVRGFSGACFKFFNTRRDAEMFLGLFSDSQNYKENKSEKLEKLKDFPNVIEIFTDGSHSKHEEKGYLGYGIFCSYRGKEYLLSGSCTKELLQEYGIDSNTKLSNPTMEFLAFAEFLKMLYNIPKDLSKYTFIVKMDYTGVEKWMNGEWRCKENYIKQIKEACDNFLKVLKCHIQIQYVPAHSNIYGNERADQLAKCKDSINTFSEFFKIL